MKRFKILIEQILNEEEYKSWKSSFYIKQEEIIRERGIFGFKEIYKQLNNGKEIHPLKWNDEVDEYNNSDFGRVIDALVYYCKKHEKDTNPPYPSMIWDKNLFVYETHLIPYIGICGGDIFTKVINYWRHEREDYNIIQTVWRMLSYKDQQRFLKLYKEIYDWTEARLKENKKESLNSFKRTR